MTTKESINQIAWSLPPVKDPSLQYRNWNYITWYVNTKDDVSCLYFQIPERMEVFESDSVTENVVFDYNEKKQLLGIEFLIFSRTLACPSPISMPIPVYDHTVDILTLCFTPPNISIVESESISDYVIADYDQKHSIVSLEFLNVSHSIHSFVGFKPT